MKCPKCKRELYHKIKGKEWMLCCPKCGRYYKTIQIIKLVEVIEP